MIYNDALPSGQACTVKKLGELQIIITKDPDDKSLKGWVWHLSISCRDRYPTWNEIKEVRYKYLPDNIYMAMILPPKGEYVNVHPNCFHLHEINP